MHMLPASAEACAACGVRPSRTLSLSGVAGNTLAERQQLLLQRPAEALKAVAGHAAGRNSHGTARPQPCMVGIVHVRTQCTTLCSTLVMLESALSVTLRCTFIPCSAAGCSWVCASAGVLLMKALLSMLLCCLTATLVYLAVQVLLC
jgi:hypothetical protein